MIQKRVMIITPSIPPYAGSGVYRNIRFIRHLDQLGWEVSVLSIREDCIRANLPRDAALLKKIPDSVHIERAHATRFLEALLRFRGGSKNSSQPQKKKQLPATQKTRQKKVSFFQNVKDFISTFLRFPDAEIGWVPWAILRGLRTYKQKKIEVFYTSGPPHSCHLVGWALQKLTGLPWVADFRDPWTRQGWIDEATKQTWHHRWKMALERRVILSANRVILNTNEMRDDFSAFYADIPSEKFTAIYNGFDPEDSLEIPQKLGDERVFTVTHAGSLYKKRTPIGLLRALSTLIEEKKIEPEHIRICLIGRCDIDGVQEEIESLGLTSCVKLMSWMTHEACLQEIAVSDLLLLIQPGTALQIPGKIFEYIMLKKNVLALSDDGATSNIVKDYELGTVANPTDVLAIKKALIQFYEKQFNSQSLPKGYLKALDIFNARALTEQLEETFAAVILEVRQ